MRRRRCSFLAVDCAGPSVRHTDEHISAAAQVPGFRMNDRQRERDGNCGIDSVPALRFPFLAEENTVRDDNTSIMWPLILRQLCPLCRSGEGSGGGAHHLSLMQERPQRADDEVSTSAFDGEGCDTLLTKIRFILET
jgi:hypothetical protein